jgi:hypothetical protein
VTHRKEASYGKNGEPINGVHIRRGSEESHRQTVAAERMKAYWGKAFDALKASLEL